MKIGVFHPEDNAEHIETLKAFTEGLRASGETVFWGPFQTYNMCDFDLAIVFGIGKKYVKASWQRGAIIETQQMAGKNVLILEKGFIKRDTHYMVGLNGLNNRANFNLKSRVMPSDRFEKLNVDLKPWRTEGEHVLLIGQVPWDASVQHTDHIAWLTNTAAWINSQTSRTVIFRPHPLAAKATPSIFGTQRSNRSLESDLRKAHAVVTFNSNTGVDALLEGIPAYADDEGSMIYSVCNRLKNNAIDCPSLYNRETWAYNLAYTQWNYEEMRSGEAWAHIKSIAFKKQQGDKCESNT